MRAVRKHWGTLLGVAISLAALGLALRGIPLAGLKRALLAANYWFLIPATALLLVSLVTRAFRWWGLLRAQVALGETFHAMNAGYLLNNILPLRLGEVGRAYLLSRGQAVSGSEALSTIVVERVLDLLTAVAILALTLPFVAAAGWTRSAGWSLGVVAVLGFAGLLLAAHQRARLIALAGRVIRRMPHLDTRLARWLDRADSFLGGLESLRDSRLLAAALCWSAVTWLLSGLLNWTLLFAFVPHPSLLLGFFVLGVAAIAYAVPSSPGQAGVLEAAIVAALVPLNIARSDAFSYALVLHLLSYVATGLLGAWALSHYGETIAGLARSAQAFLGKGKMAAADQSPKVETG